MCHSVSRFCGRITYRTISPAILTTCRHDIRTHANSERTTAALSRPGHDRSELCKVPSLQTTTLSSCPEIRKLPQHRPANMARQDDTNMTVCDARHSECRHEPWHSSGLFELTFCQCVNRLHVIDLGVPHEFYQLTYRSTNDYWLNHWIFWNCAICCADLQKKTQK
jgi:hypothetical protein